MPLVLYEDSARGDRLEIPLPLEFDAEIQEMAAHLKLPDFLSLQEYQTAKAVVVAWASQHAANLTDDARSPSARPAIPVAFFGGMGFRFQCPSANQVNGPFYRKLNDLDLLTLKKSGRALVNLLADLHLHLGTGYGFWVPRPDRMYNGFREGRRFRMTTVNSIGEGEAAPAAGKLDIFTESMSFCHDVPVEAEIASAHETNYSLSLETLVLLKTQFIKRVGKNEISPQDFQFLSPFDEKTTVIGMEPKDARDVCAALHDTTLDAAAIAKALASNWGLHRTVVLNLRNLSTKLKDLLRRSGAQDRQIEQVQERLDRLIEQLDLPEVTPKKPFFQLRRQWWRTVED